MVSHSYAVRSRRVLYGWDVMGSRPRGDCALGDGRFAFAGANLPRYRTHEPWHGLPRPGHYFGGTGVWTGTGTGCPLGSSAAATKRRGTRPPAGLGMGRRAISHDMPGGGHTFFLFFSNGLRFVSTVIRLGPLRALLQVYDTEGTASSSPDVLVRLWVASRR